MTPGDELAGIFAADLAAPPEGSLAASKSGIQRMNGVRSATSVMYQSFLAASQRAPRALTASFSAKGVTRLILMGKLSPSQFSDVIRSIRPFAVAAMYSSHSLDCHQGQVLRRCGVGRVGQHSFKVGFRLNVCKCLRIPGQLSHKRLQRNIPINPQIAYT